MGPIEAPDPRILEACLDQAGTAFLITDARMEAPGPEILYANPALSELTGYPREELIGRDPVLFQGPEADLRFLAGLKRSLSAGRTYKGHTPIYRKDGSLFQMACSVSPIRDVQGSITHCFGVVRDISRRISKEEAMKEEFKRRAVTDPLTGALTRFHFCRHLETELQRLRRYGGEASFLVITPDGFRGINEEYGFAAGDRILRELSRVIADNSRAADIRARWRGTRFALLAPETFTYEGQLLGEKLRGAVQRHAFPHVESLSVSIGLTVLTPGATTNEIIRRADDAISRASESGPGEVFTG